MPFVHPFQGKRVFAAFGRWTLVHVGPATDWGPLAYVYVQALMLFTPKVKDSLTDSQPRTTFKMF